jgi:hypothetical protein
MFFHEWKDYGDDIDKYSLNCSGAALYQETEIATLPKLQRAIRPHGRKPRTNKYIQLTALNTSPAK